MKLKKLLAATLGLSMMFAIPAYANDADAVAVYQQMEQKSKEMSDMNAFYDYKITMSDGSANMDMRMEMNVKANQVQDPEHVKKNSNYFITFNILCILYKIKTILWK